MKKQIFLLGFLTIVILILSTQAHAQQSYWHASDRYGVELDGEGDAFVVAILTFEGLKENTYISTLTLEIPGTRINVFKAIQTPYAYSYYGGYYPEYQQQPSFITYQLNKLSDSTLITLNLKTPIVPNQKTTVVLIYQTQDIAKSSINGLDFEFQTIKDSNAIIRDVGADIYVPSNMELKGKPKFDIEYKPSALAGTFSASQSVSTSEMSMYISPYYSRTAQYSAQNLDPNESFRVKGLYGENSLLLYLYEILETIVALMVIFLVFRHFKITSRIKGAFKPKTQVKVKTAEKPEVEFSWTRVIIGGIGSGFLYIIVSLLTQFIFGLLQNLGSFGSYFISLAIMLFIIIFFLPIIALFAPAIYLAKTYGWKEGLMTFIIGVITAVVLLYIITTMFSGIGYPYYSNIL